MNSVERVKQLCVDRKIPISHLEKDLGFANGYIGQLRKGVFPDDRLLAIANYLNVHISDLIGINGKETPVTDGEQKEKPTIVSDDRLPIDERTLLSMYRDIPENRKSEALAGFLDLIKKYGNS